MTNYLFFLACVGTFIREVSILVYKLKEIKSRSDENISETNCTTLILLENIELVKENLIHVYLRTLEDPSQLRFPMSYDCSIRKLK